MCCARSAGALEVTRYASLHPPVVADTLLLMARALAQIREDIQALSDADKKALLCTLWEELDGPADPDVDAAWLAEAKRRDQEIEEGVVEMIPADEVFRTLEALLKK
jgi:hypothetical protein